MKRILITLIALVTSMTAFAQTEEIFGVSLGGKYTADELISILDGKATFANHAFDPSIDNIDINIYYFTGFKYNDQDFYLAIKTAPDNVLFYISMFQLKDEETMTESTLRLNHIKAKTKLFAKYPDMVSSKTNNNGYDTYTHKYSDNVELRIVSGEEMFEIDYTDLEALRTSVTRNTEYPEIQDSFFGVKFEKKIKNTIVDAVGTKGSYVGVENNGDVIAYKFLNIRFGGSTWDFGKFSTYNDQFFIFEVNDSYPDGYSYEDERAEANAKYENLMEIMKKKYGKVWDEIDEDGNKCAYVYGKNHISIKIFNEKLRSVGGEYRRYVGIEYVFEPLFEKHDGDAESEF